MKHFCKKTILCLCLSCALLIGLVQNAFAAGISVSAGQGSVSVGDTVAFTVTVPQGSEAWTYSVSYSGNLTLESGVLDPMGFQGDSRSNTLIFRANATGTGEVSISAGSYCIDGTNYDASGYDSVSIVDASAPSEGYHHEEYTNNDNDDNDDYDDSDDNKEPVKSTDSSLASLSVDKGKLKPAFDSDVTEYKLSLPVKTEKITLTAEPSDSAATVSGTGEIAVKPGENTVSIVVTAESGDTTTYTVHAVVAQMPTVFLTYNDAKLGVVTDTEDVTAPAGFSATTISYEGSDIPAWTNEKKTVTLLYLMDEKYNCTFYAYTPEDGITGPYLPLKINGKTYIYTGIPEKQRIMPGLVFDPVNAFEQTLDGFSYEDEALAGFYVLYLMDSDGNYGYFTYDSQGKTLQRFSGAVYSANYNNGLTVPWLYAYIAGGVAAAMLLTIIILAVVSAKRKKKAVVKENAATAEKPAEVEASSECTAEEEAPTPAVTNESEPSVVSADEPTTHVEVPSEAETPLQAQEAEDGNDTLSLDKLLDDIRNM